MSTPNVGVIIIKPDATREFLTEMIIRDFENAGVSILLRKDLCFKEEDIPTIYPECVKLERYPSIVKSITGDYEEGGCPSTLLIATCNEGNIHHFLRELKGKSDSHGIRRKYLHHFWYELEKMGYSGERLRDELAKNRLHAPDNFETCLEIMRHFLTPAEKQELFFRDKELYRTIEANRALALPFKER